MPNKKQLPAKHELAKISCDTCKIGRRSVYGPTLRRNPERIAKLRQGTRTFSAGRTVLRDGYVLGEMYSILSGWAFAYKVLPDGERLIFSFLVPGDVFCLENFAFADWTANYSVQALTSLTLCTFDLEEMRAAAQSSSDEQAEECRNVARRYQEMLTRKIVDLGRRNAQARICQLIMELNERLTTRDQSDGVRFWFPATQSHIADALGITPVYASRTLAALRRERIFDLRNGFATILDAARLSAAANG